MWDEARSVAFGDEGELGDALGGVGDEACALLGVFGEDVDFKIEWIAGLEGVEIGGGVGVGDDGDGDLCFPCRGVVDGGDGEGDAFDGDGAFFDDVAGERCGRGEVEEPVGVFGCALSDGGESVEVADAVDVALHDVSAEWGAGRGGEFQVDLRAGLEA